MSTKHNQLLNCPGTRGYLGGPNTYGQVSKSIEQIELTVFETLIMQRLHLSSSLLPFLPSRESLATFSEMQHQGKANLTPHMGQDTEK